MFCAGVKKYRSSIFSLDDFQEALLQPSDEQQDSDEETEIAVPG